MGKEQENGGELERDGPGGHYVFAGVVGETVGCDRLNRERVSASALAAGRIQADAAVGICHT